MSVAAWSVLLPEGAGLACEGVPAPVREAIGAPAECDGGGVRVRVLWRPDGAAWPDLSGVEALVCLGGREPDAAALRAAGLTHVRRFHARPDAGRPRWLLPLDSPAVAAGSMVLHKPVRLVSRVGRLGAWAAARCGQLDRLGETVTVATRRVSALEAMATRAVKESHGTRNGDETMRLALATGVVDGAVPRIIAAVLDAAGEVRAFVKVAGSHDAKRRVRHEARMLQLLERELPAVRSPRLLARGEVAGRYVAVSSPLPGRAPPPRLTPAHHRFLEALTLPGPTRPASQSRSVRWLIWQAHHLHRADASREALGRLMPTLERLHLPPVVAHRDFTPWNARLQRDGELAAFDWEYALTDALPMLDAARHETAVTFLLHKRSPAHARERLHRQAQRRPLGLTPSEVTCLQAVDMLDQVLRNLGEGRSDDYARLAWSRELLRLLLEGACPA